MYKKISFLFPDNAGTQPSPAMKTVEKLRWIFAICFCMLLYILFFSNHDHGSEMKKKLEYEEMIWRRRHTDLDGVRWDSVVHFQNGRYEVGRFHWVKVSAIQEV